jgi:D-alanine--poly(phosphoribitol) ligase subunit 1
MDSQIKLHGHRVELGDVEANLCALPNVQDAVVVAVTKQGQVDSLAAFVILNRSADGSDFEVSNALKRKLAEHVPSYMVPRRVCLVGTFPMNANGKADRRKLAETLA